MLLSLSQAGLRLQERERERDREGRRKKGDILAVFHHLTKVLPRMPRHAIKFRVTAVSKAMLSQKLACQNIRMPTTCGHDIVTWKTQKVLVPEWIADSYVLIGCLTLPQKVALSSAH